MLAIVRLLGLLHRLDGCIIILGLHIGLSLFQQIIQIADFGVLFHYLGVLLVGLLDLLFLFFGQLWLLLLPSTLLRWRRHLARRSRSQIDVQFIDVIGSAQRGLKLRRVERFAVFRDGDIKFSRCHTNTEELAFVVGLQRELPTGFGIFKR